MPLNGIAFNRLRQYVQKQLQAGTKKNLADINESQYFQDKMQVARVAQLDRASVYGTANRSPQSTEMADTCENASGSFSGLLGDSDIKAIFQTTELADLIKVWPKLAEPIKAGISAMIKATGKDQQ